MGGVKGAWTVRVAWMAALLAAGRGAPAQEEGGESSEPRLLSLQASSVMGGLEQVNVDMPLMARLPDFRLKMVQPDAMSLSPDALEPKLRGVELQLPRSGLWVGYDWSEEGETPRATFSIQREF